MDDIDAAVNILIREEAVKMKEKYISIMGDVCSNLSQSSEQDRNVCQKIWESVDRTRWDDPMRIMENMRRAVDEIPELAAGLIRGDIDAAAGE